MCQIVCKTCELPIEEQEDVLELLQGFVEAGAFTPEQEIAFYHPDCYSAQHIFSE